MNSSIIFSAWTNEAVVYAACQWSNDGHILSDISQCLERLESHCNFNFGKPPADQFMHNHMVSTVRNAPL